MAPHLKPLNKKDEMHPEDRRNMIIFMIAALAVWFIFDHYVMKPRLEALKQAKTVQALPEGGLAEAPALQPRETVIGQTQRIPVENGTVFGSVSLKGGRLDDLSLHRYFKTLEKKDNVVLLTPAGTAHARYVETGWLADDESVSVPGKDTVWTASGGALNPSSPVTLTWDNGQGLRFERRIAIDGNYMFTLQERVINNTGRTVKLFPYNRLAQLGLPSDHEKRMVVHEGPIAYLDGELTERPYKKMDDEPLEAMTASTGWIGISDKYWFTSLIPPQEGQKTFRFVYEPAAQKDGDARYQTDVVGEAVTIASGESAETTSRVFAGAKEVRLLDEYERTLPVEHFDLAVDFGLYYFLTKPFFYILDFFGRVTGNMGIALICLTVIVRLAVFPLANTSFRSFAQLKKISPQMKELREKYGDDRSKLQAELVKLYEKEKVNPMAGCLPLLLQIPIFFALFKILNVTIEMRHAPFFGWIQDLSAHDPLTVFNLFGLIDWTPPALLMIGPWSLMMLVAMLVQRTLNPPPQDPTQVFINNTMPFFITFIMAKYAVGLVIYWTFSNTLSVLQQMLIMKKHGVEIHLFRTREEKEMLKMVRKGPNVHPELVVAEEKVEEAIFGDKDGDAAEEPVKVSPPKPKKKKKR